MKDGVARAIRTLRAATGPAPADQVVPLSPQMIGLRFTTAAAAAWRRTPRDRALGAGRPRIGVDEPGRVDHRRHARRQLEDLPDGRALLRGRNRRARRRLTLPVGSGAGSLRERTHRVRAKTERAGRKGSAEERRNGPVVEGVAEVERHGWRVAAREQSAGSRNTRSKLQPDHLRWQQRGTYPVVRRRHGLPHLGVPSRRSPLPVTRHPSCYSGSLSTRRRVVSGWWGQGSPLPYL